MHECHFKPQWQYQKKRLFVVYIFLKESYNVTNTLIKYQSNIYTSLRIINSYPFLTTQSRQRISMEPTAFTLSHPLHNINFRRTICLLRLSDVDCVKRLEKVCLRVLQYSTLHADYPLSAKLRGKFKLCEETHGGHYLGHSQNSAELINFLGGTLER